MTHASPTLILYPVFAMFLLVIIVLLYMGRMRIAAVKKGELNIKFFRATRTATSLSDCESYPGIT